MNYNGYDTEEDQEYYRGLMAAPRLKREQRLEDEYDLEIISDARVNNE
jgi:hypothetical protein